MQHHYQDLIDLFNHCFSEEYNTRLVKGENEPIYLPANESCSYNALYFAHGYFSSALHECAHWLIAGAERRKQVDFGYWYMPDGRSEAQQILFQAVEIKPQALEWILSKACGHKFHISIDNLNGVDTDPTEFKQKVYEQVAVYCKQGLAPRTQKFREALCSFYNQPIWLREEEFSLELSVV
jgi:elongation factor P hydroxylase